MNKPLNKSQNENNKQLGNIGSRNVDRWRGCDYNCRRQWEGTK
jgi:hypothetical protein